MPKPVEIPAKLIDQFERSEESRASKIAYLVERIRREHARMDRYQADVVARMREATGTDAALDYDPTTKTFSHVKRTKRPDLVISGE